MSDLIGKVIAHYRLDALIGDGGMGTVYKAYDLNLERVVAIKVMHAHYARQEEFRARLAQEAKTAAALDHPSIVRIFDFGQYNGGLYIAMEYVGGGNLRAHLQRLQSRKSYLPLRQSLQIGMQIADALDYAHKQSVVHRDVKPGNIILKRLIRPDNPEQQPFRAILTDFGLVKLLEGDSMTQSGTTLGTPTYMSPEQCEGLVLDGRSDLYSLGVVLYELVTNQLPFKFRSLSEAMATHMRGEMPSPLDQIRPGLPPFLNQLLAKALAKDPGDRYATGSEMANALSSAMFSLEEAPTRVVSRTVSSEVEAKAKDIPGEGYRLRIETPGREPSYARLTRNAISIGRNADNDIVLPAEGVSRYHVRLDASDAGWTVTDLGGINGTWLNGERLLPNKGMPLELKATLEVGPYQLVLEYPTGTESPIDNLPIALTIPSATAAVKMGEINQIPLALFLSRDSLTVEPGRRVELRVEVFNRGQVTESVSIRVHGVPDQWLSHPAGFIQVPPGGSTAIPILIQPPRRSATPAGRQRLRIELNSQKYPNVHIAEQATLVIGTFESFEVNMTPQQIGLPGVVRVMLRNTGNGLGEFSIVGRDHIDRLRFTGERGRINLQPGQVAAVDLQLDVRGRSLFGEKEDLQFEIEVASSSGSRQTVRGMATLSPMLPTGILYAAVFIVVFLCVLSALFLVFQRDQLPIGPPATQPGLVGGPETATAAGFSTATAVASATFGAATEAAATAIVEGDRDSDGLSDSQEQIIGTDPDNPDTDADGLLDGEEVLTWGTDPLNRDTDGDILIDGDEVRTYGTSPTNPDTDGDGIPDGVEVAMGTNPLDPLDPPPTATATTILPTNTPTSVQPTSLPSATSTALPTATNTTTAEPTSTPTPTETPTFTPTPTETSTPTMTIPPNPDFGCSNTRPKLDGIVDVAEWGNNPMFEFAPDDDVTRRVQGYMVWVADQLYMAFIINDPSNNQLTDSLKVYFDANNNKGDPDSEDRFFQIARDGTTTVRAGIGSNVDNLDWNPEYESDNWEAMVRDTGTNQWVVEVQIDASNEMPVILNGQPVGMMAIVLYTGSQGIWPQDAISNNAGTWQAIENGICQ